MEHFKTVSLYELFYDLVFVYAISKLTSILETTVHGWIPASQMVTYLLHAAAILQVWLFQTNYNNRFGTGRPWENLLMAGNMMAALFLANILDGSWSQRMLIFPLLMAWMLGSVALSYGLHSHPRHSGCQHARTFARVCGLVVAGYVLCAAARLILGPVLPIYYAEDLLIVAGIFLPLVTRNIFHISIVDFHHLTERFELLTIVTFGELITSLADWFTFRHISWISFGAFALVLLLFLCYVLHNHVLMDRTQKTRGLILMYSHFVLITGLDLIAAGQTLVLEDHISPQPFTILMAFGLVLFFAGLFANEVYVPCLHWKASQILLLGTISLAGFALMFATMDTYVDLWTMLAMSAVAAALLFWQAKQRHICCSAC